MLGRMRGRVAEADPPPVPTRGGEGRRRSQGPRTLAPTGRRLSGRLRRSARSETVRAHNLGSSLRKPSVGRPVRRATDELHQGREFPLAQGWTMEDGPTAPHSINPHLPVRHLRRCHQRVPGPHQARQHPGSAPSRAGAGLRRGRGLVAAARPGRPDAWPRRAPPCSISRTRSVLAASAVAVAAISPVSALAVGESGCTFRMRSGRTGLGRRA
jgi:hypothetical protein